MLYKKKSRKGNITVVLIGLISVMLIMVAAMSRRMTGHTQLLTLGDYTQISRYFLESYVGDVMQQIRERSHDPASDFSQQICDSVDGTDVEKTLNVSYSASGMLKELGIELGIASDYKPKIEIIKTEPLGYPQGIDPGEKAGIEKKGLLQLTCKCNFRSRDYTLVVQYPFIIGFRLTPIIKDFMLFVDNMAKEQEGGVARDYINVLRMKDGTIDEEQDCRTSISRKIRPMILLPPLDNFVDRKVTGNVYLGPSDKAVYVNLGGEALSEEVASPKDYSDMFRISAQDLGGDADKTIDYENFPLTLDSKGVALRGFSIDLLAQDDKAKMGVMGFCGEFETIFGNLDKWKIEDFLGDESKGIDYWKKIKAQYRNNDIYKALSYSSGLKLFGIDYTGGATILDREVYGNVFARFMVLSFWQPGSAAGQALVYDENMTTSDVPEVPMFSGKAKFEPKDSNTDYKFFMSRIISGKEWKDSRDNEKPDFMPININSEKQEHQVYGEDNFAPQDGFRLNSLKFHNFGKTWFKVTAKGAEPSAVEKRIGRTFKSGDDFKKAVGYPEKFKVNGVVYVKGNLKLDDMSLKPENCSGGIVLVDGSITLGNIERGKKVDASRFSFEEAATLFPHCNDPNNEDYISQDKILTFVSLKGDPITVKGDVLLGVQLVNLADSHGDKIKFESGENLVFFGSMACSRLNLAKRLIEFGNMRSSSKAHSDIIDAPFFMYPPVMASSSTSLAVQIMENMRGYKLTSGKAVE